MLTCITFLLPAYLALSILRAISEAWYNEIENSVLSGTDIRESDVSVLTVHIFKEECSNSPLWFTGYWILILYYISQCWFWGISSINIMLVMYSVKSCNLLQIWMLFLVYLYTVIGPNFLNWISWLTITLMVDKEVICTYT